MHDEFAIEEMRIRAELERMDAAFCAAMLRAIDAGDERTPEAICKEAWHTKSDLCTGQLKRLDLRPVKRPPRPHCTPPEAA